MSTNVFITWKINKFYNNKGILTSLPYPSADRRSLPQHYLGHCNPFNVQSSLPIFVCNVCV